MKKINVLLVSLLFVLSGVFVGCSKDENAVGPTVDLISVAKDFYISANAEVTVGDSVYVKFLVTKGDAKLATMTVTIGSGINANWNAKDISGNDTYQGIFGWKADELGTKTITFTATDKDGLTGSKSIVVTVTAEYSEYTAKILYDALAANTSKTFFSSLDGGTYTITEAVANKAKIDFGFLYDQAYATTKACLISFDEYSLTSNYTAQLTGLTLNATIFKKVAAVATYDGITDAASIETAYTGASAIAKPAGSTYTDGKIAAVISAGDIIAFKTNDSRYGLLKVVAINRAGESTNNTQTMEIAVKVQK
jgi:hypothetical protein